MSEREFDPSNPDEDWLGHNAAFRCDACKRTYIVSGFLHEAGRPCPHCQATVGHVQGTRGGGAGRAWIERPDPA